MKAETPTHATQPHAPHRPAPGHGRGNLAVPPEGDPFAQLLADLCTQDAPQERDDVDAAVQASVAADTVPGLAPASVAPLPPLADAPRADGPALLPAEGDTRAIGHAERLSDTRDPRGSTDIAAMATAANPGDVARPDGMALPGAEGLPPDLAAQTPTQQADAPAAPFGTWVSTLARSKQRAPAPPRAAPAEGIREAPPWDGAGPQAAGAKRPEHVTATDVAAPVAVAVTAEAAAARADAGTAGERRDAARGTDAPTHGGHASADTAETAAGAAPADPTEFGLQLGQALGEAFEAIGAQVSLWAAGKTQRASFSVEEGLDDPLAVDMTVTDGVAQLSFRTDDGALRQLIQTQGPAALADALAQAGLRLGGFDVGGQSARDRHAAPPQTPPHTMRVGLTDGASASGIGPGSRVGTVRPDRGRAGLDVYA